MGSHLVCLGVVVSLAAVGGCSSDPVPERDTTPVRTSYPAATAGGACVFFDYDAIEKAIGARFDVAAASQSAQTTTCVVQSDDADLPDLTLAISKTSADADVFKTDVMPDKGATAIKNLGLAAYQAPVAAAKDAGAGVEICWLTKDKRLMSLRFTGALDAPAPPKSFAGKLVALAKEVETAKAPKQP
ncbi:hypothetical protein AB0J74_29405 [Asanoa sp. NPDC049573]|uniref:hypothetical protein n=1 Tax=Asanoa sp. NPDC049573 TaxID=3155396 RepID=UPI0034343112